MSIFKTGLLFILLLIAVIISGYFLGSFLGSHFVTVDLSTPVVIVQEPSPAPTIDDQVNLEERAAPIPTPTATETPIPIIPDTSGNYSVYLPLVLKAPEVDTATVNETRRVNIPYFKGSIQYPETAIFWFGRVNADENFVDVRLGYNDDFLFINLAVYDRRLWYDTKPSPSSLTEWDSVSIYLKPEGNHGEVIDKDCYRFDAMLNWWESRADFQASFQGNGNSWDLAHIDFVSTSGWRGHAPNNNTKDDRGWVATFRIPFSSFGLSGDAVKGTVWGLGVKVHDRDDAAGPARAPKLWPESLVTSKPSSWGQIHFGIPGYTAPEAEVVGEVRIRHGFSGAHVPGGAVGGGTTCGAGLSFWNEWGDTVHPGSEEKSEFNIQNQSDVSDWPCFARYYLTFPMDFIPQDKVILSARLILHQMGNSGGGRWGAPPQSYIQVFTIKEDWDEKTISWNNAPLALENIGGTWVDPIGTFPGWPGVPWEWEVSRAAADAHFAGEPLRLALYSADEDYHSGKYFVSSYTGNWNAAARPTLVLLLGEP
jgi:hypothetical protein